MISLLIENHDLVEESQKSLIVNSPIVVHYYVLLVHYFITNIDAEVCTSSEIWSACNNISFITLSIIVELIISTN